MSPQAEPLAAPWNRRSGLVSASQRRLAVIALGCLIGCGRDQPTSSDPARTLTENGFFASNNAQLHYALDLPSGSGPFPTVVIGHGSGRVTKEEGAAHAPFLLGHGFAVLRYDKRGAGQSTGTYRGLSALNSELQVQELAGDMLAGVVFLRTRREVDSNRIGLMGVSQAGWVMIAAAERSPDVKFFVAVVGSTVPVGANVFYEQTPPSLSLDEAYARLATYEGPPGYDPVPALRNLHVPAIWVLGSNDRLVPTRECRRTLDALRQEGHRFAFRMYDGFGHDLGGRGSVYWPDVFSWLDAGFVPLAQRTEPIRAKVASSTLFPPQVR